MNSKTSGRIGEAAAEAYLKGKGHRIITVNYRTYGGELDIVSLRGGVLVFTEVKSKSSGYRGSPRDELGGVKTKNLVRAAYWFRKTECSGGRVPYYTGIGRLRFMLKYKNYRFDLVEVFLQGDTAVQIIHTKNVIKTEK